MRAITRQVARRAHHAGQIVYLAKHFAVKATGKWESLSVPREESKQFAAGRASEKWIRDKRRASAGQCPSQ